MAGRYSFKFGLLEKVRDLLRNGEVRTVTGIYYGLNDVVYKNGNRGMFIFYELDDDPGTSRDEADLAGMAED